jgi:glutamate dehydrogenase/leucine dehydrogenase
MSIILEQSANEHELLAIHRDADAGLVAAIAIHNRSLGPAIGGCRVYPYQTIDTALELTNARSPEFHMVAVRRSL